VEQKVIETGTFWRRFIPCVVSHHSYQFEGNCGGLDQALWRGRRTTFHARCDESGLDLGEIQSWE
jgi:hypothetical protein